MLPFSHSNTRSDLLARPKKEFVGILSCNDSDTVSTILRTLGGSDRNVEGNEGTSTLQE